MDISLSSHEKTHIFGRLTLAVITLSAVFTLGCLAFQFRHYRTPVNPGYSVFDYPTLQADCEFIDIHWKNRDYDYIEGYLSLDGKPVTGKNVRLVFYLDDGTFYYFPLKVRNHYTQEQEDAAATKDLREFLYHDREYITDAGEPTDRSWFYCLLLRDNIMRNNYKIGFLIDEEDVTYFAATDVLYEYFSLEDY